jgi:hypothetical protein
LGRNERTLCRQSFSKTRRAVQPRPDRRCNPTGKFRLSSSNRFGDGLSRHESSWYVMEKSEQTAISEVCERLAQRHPTVPPLTIAKVVYKVHAKFDGRPIRDFVPLFVERDAQSELAKLDA